MGRIIIYKILDRHELERKVSQIQSKDESKIILAGGCFDIFHIGHLNYLELAKKQGDILIVALNSDDSINKIKGSPPVFSSNQRSRLLAALEVVDFVYIFPETDLCCLLRSIKPNIFVKGIDYKGIPFPEREVANKHNIDIRILGNEKISSSRILRDKLL